jgi:hypothetical protein
MPNVPLLPNFLQAGARIMPERLEGVKVPELLTSSATIKA